MKIIGFIKIEGNCEMVLSADSALLNQQKPFFLPDWSEDIRYTPCRVLRISRLGKNISSKFAQRYYDAVAPGADFIAWDILQQAIDKKHSWTNSIAFDYSLAVGNWQIKTNEEDTIPYDATTLISDEQAICQASQCMTIRQGDLIYIWEDTPSVPAQKEDIVSRQWGEQATLYCKIK